MSTEIKKVVFSADTDDDVIEFLMDKLSHEQKKKLHKRISNDICKETSLLNKLEHELNPGNNNYDADKLASALTNLLDYYNLGKNKESQVVIYVMNHEGRYYPIPTHYLEKSITNMKNWKSAFVSIVQDKTFMNKCPDGVYQVVECMCIVTKEQEYNMMFKQFAYYYDQLDKSLNG